jgi:POT family proton-dependent oligopeptide transporter
VLQAEQMDRRYLGIEWDSSQIQAVNPILILIYIPLFSYVIYPALGTVMTLTPLRKISLGFFVMVAAFGLSALIEEWIQQGQTPNIGWQILAYEILTASEVMVSITCLEFSYTQAPNRMKSLIMSLYLLSVSLGNLLTSVINQVIQKPDGTTWLPGASYFWFFTGLMAAASIGFLAIVATYKERTYVQQAGEA